MVMRGEKEILEEIGRHKDHVRCLEEELQYVRARECDLAPGDECEIYISIDGAKTLIGKGVVANLMKYLINPQHYTVVLMETMHQDYDNGGIFTLNRSELEATGRHIQWYWTYEPRKE